MKTIFFTFSLLFCFLGASAQDAMTLEDAVKFALQNSTSIKNAQINIADANQQIKENKASGLPQAKAEVSLQHFLLTPKTILPDFISPAVFGILSGFGVKDRNGNPIAAPTGEPSTQAVTFVQSNNFSGSVSVSQLLYSGSYNVALDASRSYRDLVNKQLASKQAEVKNAVTEAYLPTLILTESTNNLDKNIKNLEKLFKDVTEIKKAGFSEQLDVDRIELSLANLRTERENLTRQKELVVNVLKFTINYPLEKSLEVKDNINSLLQNASEEEMAGAINYSNRAEYVTAQAGLKMNDLAVQLNKTSNLPTVAAFGSYQYTVTGNNSNIFKNPAHFPTGLVGLTGSISLWDSGKRSAQVQRAMLARDLTQNQIGDLERAISLQVTAARLAYRNAANRVESQKKNLALAEKIYNTTKIKYKEGLGSSLEITSAETSLYQAQQNVLQAQYDTLVAKMSLNKALGK